MVITKYEIVFDRTYYYAGEDLTGVIEISFASVSTILSLMVRTKGIAKVVIKRQDLISDSISDLGIDLDEESGEDLFTCGRQSVLSNKQIITESKSNNGNFEPGDYTFPFCIPLPENLPTSFEGKRGFIRYYLISVLARPWKEDLTLKEHFKVVKNIDLNAIELALLPIREVIRKTYGILSRRAIEVTISTLYSGFTYNETFTLTIKIKNECNIRINYIEVRFCNAITFFAKVPHSKEIEDVEVLSEWLLGAVPANTTKVFNDPWTMPSSEPLCFDSCSIIKCRYFFHLRLSLSGCHRCIKSNIPIFYGTIPIRTGDSERPIRTSVGNIISTIINSDSFSS